MLASILVPVRNGERYLKSALDSVEAAANGTPHEVIVQDAESTDHTAEIVAQHRGHVRYYREADGGQSEGLNRALAKSTGAFVGWFNCDDLYLPNAIRHAADIFSESPEIDVVYGDWTVIDAKDQVLREHHVGPWDWGRLFLKGNYIFTGATFFRRSIFERFGDFSVNYHYVADLEFFLRVGQGVRAAYSGHAMGAFRYHSESKSGSERFRFCSEAARVRRPYVTTSHVGLVEYGRAQGELWLSALLEPVRYSKQYSRLRLRKHDGRG